MAHLIDKDKVVAEINKRYEYLREKELNSHNMESEIRMSECQHLMFLINTIEAKEVDLEKEFDKCCENHIFDDECEVYIARHFFELGLKAVQKGK